MKKRRIVSFFLVLLLIVCAFPINASAYNSATPRLDELWCDVCIGR